MLAKLRSRLFAHRGALLYTGSNVTAAIANLLGSFVCVKLMLPNEYGAFQTAQLLVTYLTFLPLGTMNGFNRHYPYLLGKGDREGAARLAQAGYTIARLAALVAAVLAAGQAVFFWGATDNTPLFLAALAVIPIAAMTQINTIQMALLTGRQLFSWIAWTQFASAFATLALLLLVWRYPVPGQCVRLVLVVGLMWLMYSVKTGDARLWHWEGKSMLELLRIGFPLLAIAYLYQVFSVADRTLVAWVKGTEAVGHYALAGLAFTAVLSLYTPLAVATYSKANHAYGRSQNLSCLVRPVKRFLILLSVSVLPLAILIYVCLPVIVPWLLPKYSPGIRAGQIACIASVAFCYSGTSFVFMVTGRNRFGFLVAGAVAAFILLGLQIPEKELTLERVAWLRTITTACLCLASNVALVIYFWRGIRRERLNGTTGQNAG